MDREVQREEANQAERTSVPYTAGQEKVSITITRKSKELMVSQTSASRWFYSEEAAVKALREITNLFAEPEDLLLNHKSEAVAEAAGQITAR